MRFSRENEETITISGLNLFLCELILQIPSSASTEGSSTAAARIFSSPVSEDDEEEESGFREDWAEYVTPELAQLFQKAVATVRADLEDFPSRPTEELQTLDLPFAHLEAWINVLNQARLALGARYEVTEKDLRHIPREGDARALALFQIDFYGHLQWWFVDEISGG